MSEWDFESKGGSTFLKIKDGDTATIRIVSDTFYREQVSTKDGKLVDTRSFTDSEWEQARSNSNYILKDRFIWGIFSRDDKAAHLFEVGAQIYYQIKALAQDADWGNPRGYDIKVKRDGSGLETKYTVTPGKNQDPISEEESNAVFALDIELIVKGARPLADVVKDRG